VVDVLRLADRVVRALLVAGGEQDSLDTVSGAAGGTSAAEAHVARVTRESQNWLPRLGYEFTQLKSDLYEKVARALARLDQGYEQAINTGPADRLDQLPERLLADLRTVELGCRDDLARRVGDLAHQFLDGRTDEFAVARLSDRARQGSSVRLVPAAELPHDASVELMTSIGQFSSGRQSISLVSAVATAAAVPVAMVGAVVGLGFWRLGRRSRQQQLLRQHATRWVKAQTVEAGRQLRYTVDATLNDAQLAMNLAVREYYEVVLAEARASANQHRQVLSAAQSDATARAEQALARVGRAAAVRDRFARLAGDLAAIE
jgi:hypothetical protein